MDTNSFAAPGVRNPSSFLADHEDQGQTGVRPGSDPTFQVRQSTVGAFVILLRLTATAVAQPCPALQVRNPAGNYIIPGVKGDIPYRRSRAECPRAARSAALRPSVVVIHGGAWTSGSRIAHVGQILELLTHAGYNWFSIDYRLGGLFRFEENSLADIRSAPAFIRCHAADFRIAPDRFVLLGEDSGAHLAALVARERPAGLIGAALIGGFYDLERSPGISRDIDCDVLTRATLAGRAGLQVRLLVVHGGADSEEPADHARRYCAQMAQDGGRCQFIEVAGASHRSENGFQLSGPTNRRWSAGCLQSLASKRLRIPQSVMSF